MALHLFVTSVCFIRYHGSLSYQTSVLKNYIARNPVNLVKRERGQKRRKRRRQEKNKDDCGNDLFRSREDGLCSNICMCPVENNLCQQTTDTIVYYACL